MSCAISQGYVLDCQDNTGGSREFYIAEFSAVAATDAAGVVTGIVKDAGKQFYRYEQTQGVAETDETLTTSRENGTTFSKQTVKLIINKRQTSVRNELRALAGTRVVIIEIDQNGQPWYFGLKNGLFMPTATAKSGKASGDRNGYEITFEGEEPQLAHSVSDSLIATLTTPGT